MGLMSRPWRRVMAPRMAFPAPWPCRLVACCLVLDRPVSGSSVLGRSVLGRFVAPVTSLPCHPAGISNVAVFRAEFSAIDADTPRIRGVSRIRGPVYDSGTCRISAFRERTRATFRRRRTPHRLRRVASMGRDVTHGSARYRACASRIAFIERFVSVRAHSTPKVCVFSILAPVASLHPSQWRVRRFDGRKGGPSECRAYRDVVGATAPPGERNAGLRRPEGVG